MVKRQARKAPAVARSELRLRRQKGTSYLRESYRLVKTRLLDIHDFIEVTLKDGRKIILSKSIIESVFPVV